MALSPQEKYFRSNKFKKILKNYEESVKSGTHPFLDADDYTDIGEYYCDVEGDFDKAKEVLEYAITIYPDDVAPLSLLAKIAMTVDNDADKAIRYVDMIDEQDDIEVIYLKAEILMSKGEFEKADDYCRGYLSEIPPEEYDDYVKEVAVSFNEFKEYNLAFQWIMRAKVDDSEDYAEILGLIMANVGEYDKSEEMYTLLTEKDPYNDFYWSQLAAIQLYNGKISKAIESCDYAIAIAPFDPHPVKVKANALYKIKNYPEATKYFAKFAKMVPEDYEGECGMAICLCEDNKPSEAFLHLEKAEKIAKTLPDGYKNKAFADIAFLYDSLGMPEKALSIIENVNIGRDADIGEFCIIKGHIYLSNHITDKATECFKEAIRKANNKTFIALRVSLSMMDHELYKQAYLLIKKAISLSDSPQTHGYAHLALCCMNLNKPEECLESIKKAVEMNPDEAVELLGKFFPEDMAPKDYYLYMYNKLYNENQA